MNKIKHKKNSLFILFLITIITILSIITYTSFIYADKTNEVDKTNEIKKSDTDYSYPSKSPFTMSDEEIENSINQQNIQNHISLFATPRWIESSYAMDWEWKSSGTDPYNWGYAVIPWDYGNGSFTYDWFKIEANRVEGDYRIYNIYAASSQSSNYASLNGTNAIWYFPYHIVVDGVETAIVEPTKQNVPISNSNPSSLPASAWKSGGTIKVKMGEKHKIEIVVYNTFSNTKSYMVANMDLPKTKFTVKFQDDDGTQLKTEVVDKGQNATAPTNPSKTGHTFTGWDKTFTNIQSDLTVTAQYKINQYTAIFDGNGGTPSFDSITKNYQEKLGTLPDATRKGFTFEGWFTSPTGGTKISSETTMPLNGATYYAHWQRNKYSINTSVENGTITNSSEVYFEDNQTIQFSPKDGYVLDQITVDGKDLDISKYSDIDSYIFKNVENNHSINVKYIKASPIKITIEKQFIDKSNNILSQKDLSDKYGISDYMTTSKFIMISTNKNIYFPFSISNSPLVLNGIQKGEYSIKDMQLSENFEFIKFEVLENNNSNISLNIKNNNYSIAINGDSRSPRSITIKSVIKVSDSVMGDVDSKSNYIKL